MKQTVSDQGCAGESQGALRDTGKDLLQKGDTAPGVPRRYRNNRQIVEGRIAPGSARSRCQYRDVKIGQLRNQTGGSLSIIPWMTLNNLACNDRGKQLAIARGACSNHVVKHLYDEVE